MKFKILHFSSKGIPDSRIEKYAYIQQNQGQEVFFCGKFFRESKNFPETELFDQEFLISSNDLALIGIHPYFKKYKEDFEKVYSTINPDIVHAHDIVPAKVCSDLGIDFIYDDHEYWSKQILFRQMESFKRIITNPLVKTIYPKWEKQILQKASVILTVSDTIASEHSYYGQPTFTVPNYPSIYELEYLSPLQQSRDELSLVLIAKGRASYEREAVNDLSVRIKALNCPTTIIGKADKSISSFDYMGVKPYYELYHILPKHHLGFIETPKPKVKHGYLKYISPNRIFQYAHCGVTPVLLEDMTSLVRLFGDMALIIPSFIQLSEYIEPLKENKEFLANQPSRIQDFAKQNLIWESLIPIIGEAYDLL